MWMSALFGGKISDFSKVMVCPHGQVVLSQCGHIRTRERGQFFAILCERPLWTAPYDLLSKCLSMEIQN